MAQTYAPGTILSFGIGSTLEQVIALTDNKVATKTFAGKPVDRRDILSLADWEILAKSQGQGIETSFIPVPVATPVATPVAAPKPAPVPEKVYLAGTMLRWKKDEDNKRCAIVLKDGILQVKEVVMGRITMDNMRHCNCKQMFFSSLADWKSTLPADGTLTASEATEDHSIPSIRRKASEPVTATTDTDYIKVLLKRFSVRSHLIKKPKSIDVRNSSVNTLIDNTNCIQKHLDAIKAIGTDTNLKADTIVDKLRSIRDFAEAIDRDSRKALSAQCDLMYGGKGNDVESYRYTNDYRQVLCAFVGDKKVEITSDHGLIGIAYNKVTKQDGKWVNPTVGKTFAELGIQLKADGKPRLVAHYRRSEIEV